MRLRLIALPSLACRPVAGEFGEALVRTSDEALATVERVFKPLPPRTTQSAFPHHQHPPARCPQAPEGYSVSLAVARDFLTPEFWPCRRPFEHRATMPVPEAAMHEDDGLVPRKHEIGLARKVFPVQPEAQAQGVQAAPKDHFRFCVAAANAAHIQSPLFGREHVCHDQPQFVASATIIRTAALKSSAVMPGRSVVAPNRKLRRYSGWNSRPGNGVFRYSSFTPGRYGVSR